MNKTELVLDLAGTNQLDQVRSLPVRIGFPIRAWIVSIPVPIPAKILRRPRNILMSEARASALTPLQKEMADRSPGDWDSRLFENMQNIGNILPGRHRPPQTRVLAASPKGPGNLEIR